MENDSQYTKYSRQEEEIKGIFTFVAVLIFFFAVYTKTLCPTVFWWDSGELIANIKLLGIPHRPGFPIYVLLGKFFSFLPFGAFALKVNLLSALFASLSLAIFYKIYLEALNLFLPEITKKREVVLLSALSLLLVLGFTYSFWIQAVRAEVYSLNILFFSLLLLLAILFIKAGDLKYLHLFSFLFGLGLGNHHLSLLSSAPALLFLILFSPSDNKSVQNTFVIRHSSSVMTSILFFLLGLSIYLYLPIRSLSHPSLAWGEVKSLSSAAGSIFALDTIENLSMEFLLNITGKLSQIFHLLSDQLTILCFAFSLLGVFLLFRHNWKFLIFLLLLIVGNIAVVIFMATEFISTNPDLHGYLLFSVFSLAFFYGIAILLILNNIHHSSWFGFASAKGVSDQTGGCLPASGGHHKSIIRHCFLIIFAAISFSPFFKHYKDADLSNNRIAHNYGLSVISDLDSNSVLFADNVNLNFILRELQHAEETRKDVTVIDRGLLSFDWYAHQKKEEHKAIFRDIPANLAGETLFSVLLKRCQELGKPTYIEFTERDSSLVGHLIPAGYVFRVSQTQIDRLPERDSTFQKRWNAHFPFDLEDEVFQKDWDAQRVFVLSFYRLGLFYEWKGMTSYALDKFWQVRMIDPENEELFLKIKNLQALQTSLPDSFPL